MMKNVYGFIVIALLTFSCSDNGKEIVGIWNEDTKDYGETIIIYRQNHSLYLESRSGQFLNSIKEMTAKEVKGHVGYFYKEGNGTGMYYVIDDEKNLGVYGENGLMQTLDKENKVIE